MLTFLNSAVLVGLAAIAIPILIHLFTRKKTKVVYFSTLKFLKELQKQKIRRLKLRQILLLILRTLVILALVMAFSRPTVRSTDSASLQSGAQITAVIILDNTLSMGRLSEGRRLMDYAKDLAANVASLMRQGDEIYVVYPHAPPKLAHEGARYNLETVQDLIADTELSYERTDYAAALALANQLMLQSNNINKEVYLIGDLQKNGLQTGADGNGSKLLSNDIKLFVLPVTANDNIANLAISELRLSNQILEKDKVAEVQARIQNTTQNPVQNKLAHLFVNGKRLGQDVVNLEPQAAANLVFRIVPDQTGFQSGYVLLEDDDLLEDNRRFFAFNISDEIPVLLVGNRPQDTHYLKLALRPEREVASYIDIKETNANGLESEELSNFQVVILSNVPKLASSEVQKLQSFVKSGGGLLLFLGADVDLRSYNEHLHKKLNLPDLTQTLNRKNREQFLTLGKIDYTHPIFRGVFTDEKYVESPHVRFAVDVQTDDQVDKIIEYSNGAPFLFEAQLQQGRILYVTTSISRDWSDLILRGLFVPLVNRSVMYLSGGASAENEQLLIGEEIRYASERITAGARLAIEKPDGALVKIKPEVTRGNYLVRFGQTNMPGTYKLLDGDRLVMQWAVNYDPQELQTSGAFEMAQLADEVDESRLYVIERGEEIAARLNQTRFGRELWKILAVIALIAIVMETALLKEKTNERAATQEV